jgi:hypothetical protein
MGTQLSVELGHAGRLFWTAVVVATAGPLEASARAVARTGGSSAVQRQAPAAARAHQIWAIGRVDALLVLLFIVLIFGVPFIIVGLLVKARNRVVPSTRDVPEGWYTDPLGRHERRYWGGDEWTGDVSDDGVIGEDPLDRDRP